MRHDLKIALIVFVAACWSCTAPVQNASEPTRNVHTEGVDVPLFTPSPLSEVEPEICSIFSVIEADFEARFKVDKQTRVPTVWEIETHLQSAFPDTKYLNGGFGPKAYMPFDYDHDGHEEIFYFEYEDPSNRPGTKTIFLYETQAEIDADLATLTEKGMQKRGTWSGTVHAIKGKAICIGTFTQWNNHIYRINGELYLHGIGSAGGNDVSIYRVDIDRPLVSICDVGSQN